MKKTVTLSLDAIMRIQSVVDKEWEAWAFSLQPIALFNLITLKRLIVEKVMAGQETLREIFRAHKYEPTPRDDGALEFRPPQGEENNAELIATVNKEVFEALQTPVELSVTPIKVRDNDFVPADMMELFYDFIEVQEDTPVKEG